MLKNILRFLGLACRHKDCRLVQYQFVMVTPYRMDPLHISILVECKVCRTRVGGVVKTADQAWNSWGVVVQNPKYLSAYEYLDEDGQMPPPVVATPDSLPETF